MDRGSSLDPEFISQEELKRYGKQNQNGSRYELPDSLRKLSIREIAKLTGLSKNSILRFKNGGRPSSLCEKRIRVVAAGIAKRKLNLREAKPGPKPKRKDQVESKR